MPAAITGLGVTFVVNAVNVNADGTFMLSGAAPAATSFQQRLSCGWGLRSVMMDGVDVLDIPFTVRPGQNIENVVVTFIDQLTEISGTSRPSQGADGGLLHHCLLSGPQSTGVHCLVEARWPAPQTEGRYTIPQIFPLASTTSPPSPTSAERWFDPAFLEARLQAQSAWLSGSGKKTLDLGLRRSRWSCSRDSPAAS